MVNNAGIAGPTAAIDEIATADWKRTIDINLTGQFFCARRAVPLRTSAGVMLNVSSVAGRLATLSHAVCGDEVGGESFERAGQGTGEFGVRVNTLLPGIVEGPRMEKVIADRAHATGVSVEAMKSVCLETVVSETDGLAEAVATGRCSVLAARTQHLRSSHHRADGNSPVNI